MITLDLTLPDCRYPIHIGQGVLDRAGKLVAPHLPQPRALIVTNDVVAPLYLERCRQSLQAAGVCTEVVILPDGEAHKDWQTLNCIFDALIAMRAERKTALVALGGGVIGDMTGFAAACWQRGAPFVQIPTTLLAQVDSSVGGKTAINHPAGKNMIGAFWQPRVVLADLDVLDTLPAREFSAGLAEVYKYGLIDNLSFFEWCEQQVPALLARDKAALAHAVEVSCRMKAAIVGQDEKEQGVRALLNLGHTFGHAIEAGLGFGVWLHGEAVAAGMVLAAETAQELGQLESVDVRRIRALLLQSNLPVVPPAWPLATWFELMGHDKKVEGGQLRFVLPDRLGHCRLESGVGQKYLEKVLIHNIRD